MVWPSTVSNFNDFVDLAMEATFLVSENTYVKVELKKRTQVQLIDISADFCTDCARLLEECGLLDRIDKINWDMLSLSTYNMTQTVSDEYVTQQVLLLTLGVRAQRGLQ